MNNNIKRIAVIGPESSGKSTLCEQLSAHYNAPWVPEYSRKYLNTLNRKYNINDVIKIYTEQIKIETKMIPSANSYLFTDTEFIIAKIWCSYIFNEVPEVLESNITKYAYDFYLLTAPDLPWVDDPLREHPGKGTYFFDIYKKELESYNFSYGIVKGTGDDRLQSAIQLVDNL